jgi:hypothetical protein
MISHTDIRHKLTRALSILYDLKNEINNGMMDGQYYQNLDYTITDIKLILREFSNIPPAQPKETTVQEHL